MRLLNFTPFSAGITVVVNKYGREFVLAVNKGTFAIREDGTCSIAEAQQPLAYADECYDEPGLSSVRYESDFALHKPATDVIVNGSAWASQGRAAFQVDVSLEISTIRKTIRVFGDRQWEYLPVEGYRATTPEPFLSMPIMYERSFGGPDLSVKDRAQRPTHPGNPVGPGFHGGLHNQIAGTRLPNIENPYDLIRQPGQAVGPVGLGIVARNWRPRFQWAGTYDETWRENYFPFLPPDFDDRFFLSAPADQCCAYLRGGERLTLTNATPDGRLVFDVPSITMPITLVHRKGSDVFDPLLDTLIIEPDLRRFLITWRAAFPLLCKPTDVSQVWIGNASDARKRALLRGKRFIERIRKPGESKGNV